MENIFMGFMIFIGAAVFHITRQMTYQTHVISEATQQLKEALEQGESIKGHLSEIERELGDIGDRIQS